MPGAWFRSMTVVVVLSALAVSGPARADRKTVTFTSGFDGLTNSGGWSFGNLAFETIEPEGGNPGGYLRNRFLDASAAEPRTLAGFRRTIFHGNYRARNTMLIEVDLAVFGASSSTWGRRLTVILVDDGGTPEDPSDDCRVYTIGGHPTPTANGNWKRYRFRIPSQSTTLPKKWAVQGCPELTDDEAWNRVITGVDQLRFFTGDPRRTYPSDVWDVGLDNPSITNERQPLPPL